MNIENTNPYYEHSQQFSLEEYRMLRTEILQYLEEYQNVRNMMYVMTGAILALGIGTEEIYLLLLPLIVIIPSYLIALSYRNNINKIATYLRVYYEEAKNICPLKWESRLRQYNIDYSGLHRDRNSVQFVSYRLTAFACCVIYFLRWVEMHLEEWTVMVNTAEFNAPEFYWSIVQGIVGLVVFAACFWVMCKSDTISYEEFMKRWKEIQCKV